MGADAERLPTLHTTAKSDADLVAVWIKSHADSSPHTRRAYERIGRRFVDAFHAAGTDLRHATVDHVQAALEAMRSRDYQHFWSSMLRTLFGLNGCPRSLR